MRTSFELNSLSILSPVSLRPHVVFNPSNSIACNRVVWLSWIRLVQRAWQAHNVHETPIYEKVMIPGLCGFIVKTIHDRACSDIL